jgi:hypothetical protein
MFADACSADDNTIVTARDVCCQEGLLLHLGLVQFGKGVLSLGGFIGHTYEHQQSVHDGSAEFLNEPTFH